MKMIDTQDRSFLVNEIDEKQHVLIDIDKNDKKNLMTVHSPVTLRHDVSVRGDLTLGKNRVRITDLNGNIIPSTISTKESTCGEILGFNGNRCYSTKPIDNIFIKPNNPITINLNGIDFYVEEFENKTCTKNFQFVLPNSILNNIIYTQFFFLNLTSKLDSVEFDYKFDLIEDECEFESKFNKLQIKLNKKIYETKNIQTNIITKNNYVVNNKLCNLTIQRNKSINSIDSLNSPIYLIGVKIEYYINYYNQYNMG